MAKDKKKTKVARYSMKVMEYPLNPLVSKGMYKMLKDEESNLSAYIRKLIMEDKNCDEHGIKREK